MRFLLFLFHSFAAFSADGQSGSAFPHAVAAMRSLPEIRSFHATDGTRLAYSVIDRGGEARLGPLVIAEGKGESVYRYLEFAQEMQRRGYGPIYILDHRGQGFSERALPSAVHVESFDTYVQDFTKFLDGPVKADLNARGIQQKPFLVAHSMGGAIANLALKKRPDLAARVAYIAPMFQINPGSAIYFSSAMNYLDNRPLELLTGSLRALGAGNLTFGGKSKKVISTDLQRLEISLAMERQAQIHTPRASITWLAEALRSRDSFRRSNAMPDIPSVIFQGQYDTTVFNSALREYACNAPNTLLIELPGGHALHQERDPIRHSLESQMDDYFQGRAVHGAYLGCQNGRDGNFQVRDTGPPASKRSTGAIGHGE